MSGRPEMGICVPVAAALLNSPSVVCRFLTLVAALGLLTAGCKVYDPSLVGMRDGAVTEDGGSACGIRPPPRSAAADDGVDIGEIAFAIRDVVFEQGPAVLGLER